MHTRTNLIHLAFNYSPREGYASLTFLNSDFNFKYFYLTLCDTVQQPAYYSNEHNGAVIMRLLQYKGESRDKCIVQATAKRA